MSQTQSTQRQPRPESGYRRDNWWGDNDVDDDRGTGHDPEEFEYRRERAEWVAHDILKQTGELVCPIALNGDPDRMAALFEWLERGEARTGHNPDALHTDNRKVEISEPDVFVPLETSTEYGGRPLVYGQRPHRTRHNPEHGYIVGPQILDRPTDEFLEIVYLVLDHLENAVGLTADEREVLERDARRLKESGDRGDEDVLATIIHDATSEQSILED